MLICKSWICHGWDSNDVEYETEFLGEPEKIFTWIIEINKE
jgi:hypothetical protein